jgi:hypothetical protein
MRVRLNKDYSLIVTPETEVEQIALSSWISKNEEGLRGLGGLLIEALPEESIDLPTRTGLLVSWIVHVMYMLAARAEIFSKTEREELAQLTADLQKELEKR